MMTKINYVNLIFIVLISVQHFAGYGVDGRYLPTRGNTDNLDRLRELLRDNYDAFVDGGRYLHQTRAKKNYNPDRLQEFLTDILETDVQKESAEALPEAAPIRYDGLNGDFNFGIPKHSQHKNSRLILKRSAYNLLKNKKTN